MSEITLENLDAKIDAVASRLDERIDTLAIEMKAGFAKAFEQTQGGFKDHRTFMELTVEHSAKALRDEMKTGFDKVDAKFTRMDRRFDGMDERFDRLEKLIKGRPVSIKRPRRRT